LIQIEVRDAKQIVDVPAFAAVMQCPQFGAGQLFQVVGVNGQRLVNGRGLQRILDPSQDGEPLDERDLQFQLLACGPAER
jgi:hypothetical protein